MLTTRSWILAAAIASLFPAAIASAEITIDASKATRITLPNVGEGGVSTFTTPDGKKGWVRRLSSQTIPTPAYAKGKIFTGAGMNQSVFLALDAESGETVWQKPTTDNGPTSPVISEGYVAYNTESCDTESRDCDTGMLVWHETNGGTLLTQCVIAKDMLVIPHPTMQRKAVMADDAFRMMAVDLKTGKHSWDRNMTADVLAAPVAVGDTLYFTCTDGRLFCMPHSTEARSWHVVAKATSAPVVVGDTLAVSTEEDKFLGGAKVSIRRYSTVNGALIDQTPLAPVTVKDAVLSKSQRAEWDYQGPKIAASGTKLFNAPGQTINSVDIESGKVLWQAKVTGNGLTNAANALTPPALGKQNLYLGSAKGHIMAVKQSDGSLDYAYDVGEQLASQPIMANGNLYFGTANGYLICIKTGTTDATNWTAWGGNAQHNKID